MPQDISRIERRYFERTLTDRERAVFEAGVALGSICHQFVGTPVSADRGVVESIERAMERTGMLQPYRRRVSAKILGRGLKGKRHVYDYGALKEDDMRLEVEVGFGRAVVRARMERVEALDYPLMYVEHVEESG